MSGGLTVGGGAACDAGMQPNVPNIHSVVLPAGIVRRLETLPLVSHVCAVGAGYHFRKDRPLPVLRRGEVEWRCLDEALFHFYVHAGSCVETEAGSWEMPENALMYLPPGVRFRHWAGPEVRRFETYWFRMRGEALPYFFRLNQWNPSRTFLQIEESVAFIELCQSLMKILAVPPTQSTLFRLAAISARLLGRVVEAGKQAEYRHQPAKERVHAVVKQLRDSPERQFTLAELASMASLSPQHFRTVFKELTGYAPAQYHAQIKAQHAARLLVHGDQSVSWVAAQVGFEDPLYFSRWFRRLMGISPSGYVREKRFEP